MATRHPLTAFLLPLLLLALVLPAIADAQGRGQRRPPPRPHPSIVLRGQVFIGGYFYDPQFGPYPWWPPGTYPWYVPVFDRRAEVRVMVKPNEAAVYVDGYYAGIVDDFDGVFQSLPLPPGGHTIALYLEGYRTAHFNLYLRPASTLKLRHTMEPLLPGERSHPPDVAPPIAPPPAGTYEPPRTLPPRPLPAPAPPAATVGYGSLDLQVQPAGAAITIDGAAWMTSEPGHFVVQLATGRHTVEVSLAGYRTFTTEVQVREGETTPLNVSLTAARR